MSPKNKRLICIYVYMCICVGICPVCVGVHKGQNRVRGTRELEPRLCVAECGCQAPDIVFWKNRALSPARLTPFYCRENFATFPLICK